MSAGLCQCNVPGQDLKIQAALSRVQYGNHKVVIQASHVVASKQALHRGKKKERKNKKRKRVLFRLLVSCDMKSLVTGYSCGSMSVCTFG